MRIIAGTLGGRRIEAPRGRATRPTSERVREALFSALGPLDGLSVLDLYSGSGAFAIEALSRGAAVAVCVERAAAALRCLRGNLAKLELTQSCHVLAMDVARAVSIPSPITEWGPYDVVLADPPWQDVPSGRFAAAVAPLFEKDLARNATIVFEHAARDAAPSVAGLEAKRTRRYGDTALTFLECICASDAPQ